MYYSKGKYVQYKKSLKIPKGGNQNLYIEENTIQWPTKMYKNTNNDLQNIHIKLNIVLHKPH